MKNRIILLFLVIILSLSMFVSCGSADKSEDAENAGRIAEGLDEIITGEPSFPDNIYDTLEIVSGINEGSFKLNGSISGDVEMSLSLDGVMDGKDYELYGSFDAGSYGKKLSRTLLMASVGNRLYINTDSVFGLLGLDTKDAPGCYPMLLPGYDNKTFENYTSRLAWFYDGAMEKLFAGADINGENGKFTAVFSETSDYVKSADAVLEWLKSNREALETFYNETLKMADYRDYTERLFEDISDDVLQAAGLLGLSEYVGEETIRQAKESMLESLTEGELSFSELYEEVQKPLGRLKESNYLDLKEELNHLDVKDLKFGVELSEEGYVITLEFTFTDSEGADIRAAFTYEFTKGEAETSAPAKTTSLTDIVKYVLAHEKELEELSLR